MHWAHHIVCSEYFIYRNQNIIIITIILGEYILNIIHIKYVLVDILL